MGRLRLTQQTIVFGIFAVMFAAFALLLPGFATTQNIFTLLQNVAVLGILGLAMALVVLIDDRETHSVQSIRTEIAVSLVLIMAALAAYVALD